MYWVIICAAFVALSRANAVSSKCHEMNETMQKLRDRVLTEVYVLNQRDEPGTLRLELSVSYDKEGWIMCP